jgi:parallel beta-helix repeat protein
VTFNRGDTASGSYAWQIGASYVTLTTATSVKHPAVAQSWGKVTGANVGIVMNGDNVGCRISRCEILGNGGEGINIYSATEWTVENCLVRANGEYGIFLNFANGGVIRNCTVASNAISGIFYYYSDAALLNNIITADGVNRYAVYLANGASLTASDYNLFSTSNGAALGYYNSNQATLSEWRTATGRDANSLTGDPLFVRPLTGDFHERSTAGSYHGGAFSNDPANSPALDSGRDTDNVGIELAPHGNRINMGAYGGSEQASKSPSGVGNAAPTISISSPGQGAAFILPASIVAEVGDLDGRVNSVEFFHGGTNLIATAVTNPFAATWTGGAPGGTYTLTARATDNLGLTAISSPITVTVFGPPAIATQPQGVSVPEGATINLTVSAYGTAPLLYLWVHNETILNDGGRISGATAATLTITNVSTNDTGNYSVIIDNDYGSLLSQPAMVAVHQIVGLEAALDTPGRSWGTSSNSVWISQTNVTHDGIDAAQSGAVTNGQSSWMETAFHGPGSVSFWWKVSSRTNRNFLKIYVGTNEAARLHGEIDWQYRIIPLPEGEQMVRWSYDRTLAPLDGNQDRGWVDEVTFAGGPPLGIAAFSLNSATYSVTENAGELRITVLKNPENGTGTVSYATADGSALASVSGGLGDYQSIIGNLSFASNETTKIVIIPINDDPSFEGDQQFTFQLSASPGVGALAMPSNAIVTIIENDPPSTTNSVLSRLNPGAVPPHDGQLRVFLEPTNVGGQWRLAWESVWRHSGDVISLLPTGNYEVEFRPVAGFSPPERTTNAIVAGQPNPPVTNRYAVSGTPALGSIRVQILPALVAQNGDLAYRGQWRLQGDTNWHDSGFLQTGVPTGDWVVECKTVSGWITPAPRQVILVAAQDTAISVAYLVADASTGTEPAVVQFPDATVPLNNAPPSPWTGQLLSDVGYGSGTAVKRRVVLTAAHVVFDDATLTYVTGVRWFFQHYKGEFEASPQTPRGWYAFSGYAAARTNDASPGISSPASQNLDVAALYFLEDAGRGGQSGYLVSEPDQTEWVTAPALKTLLGYPAEVVSDINRGKVHATYPGNISFDPITSRLFGTSAIRGYPGMSGGPLCVQLSGVFYPAAVYLGGSGQTIVRAIDGAVATLINRADLTANTGDNNTGGGVVQLAAGGGILFAPGYFQIIVEPPEAVSAGAGWRILELTNALFFNDNAATYELPPATYTVTNQPIFGFLTPSNWQLAIVGNQTAIVTNRYVSLAPRAAAPVWSNGTLGLRFSTPAGQRYAIEGSTNLVNWTPLVTNTVTANGLLSFTVTNLTSPPRGFYRARLLP